MLRLIYAPLPKMMLEVLLLKRISIVVEDQLRPY